MNKNYIVMLNVPPDLEELVVDCLLLLERDHGFCTFPLYSHHHESKGLSLAEQVSGRQKKIRFQMIIDAKGLADLLAQLQEKFSGSGISYWVFPITESGVI
ncbi:MAG: DUF3240 family protein [Methylococcaceae bacterium]